MTTTNLKRVLFDEAMANHLATDACFKISTAARGANRIAETLVSKARLMKWQLAALRKPEVLAAFLASNFDVSKWVSRDDLNKALAYSVETGIFSLIPIAIAAGARPNDTYVSLLRVSISGESNTSSNVTVPLICKAASIRRSSRALALLLEADTAKDDPEVLKAALAQAVDADRDESVLLLQVALSACALREGIGSRPGGAESSTACRIQDIL